MKKFFVFIVMLLLVLLAGWLGASWFIGQQTEAKFREKIEQINQAAGTEGSQQVLVSYERSLLSARAVTRLQIHHPLLNNWFEQLPVVHEISHGPLLFGKDVQLGLSRWKTTLDTGSLDQTAQDAVDAAFAGSEPFQFMTQLGFDQIVHYQLKISPLETHWSADEGGATLKLDSLQADGSYDPKAGSGPMQLVTGALEIRNPEMTVSTPALQLATATLSADQLNGLGEFTLKAADTSVRRAGQADVTRFNLEVQSDASQQGEALEGNLTMAATQFQGLSEGIKQLDLKLDYSGLNLLAFQQVRALNEQANSIQAQLEWTAEDSELPEEQKQINDLNRQQMEIGTQIVDLMLQRVLQPEKSRLQADLTLALTDGKLLANSQLDYAGLGQPVAPEVLNALLKYDTLDWGRLLRGTMRVQLDKKAVPADLQMLLAYPLAQRGLIEQDDQYRLQLGLHGETVDLNGVVVNFKDLSAKFVPQLPKIDETTSMGIPPDLMHQIETEGLTPEVMQQLEESDDVSAETRQLLRQLQEMSKHLQ